MKPKTFSMSKMLNQQTFTTKLLIPHQGMNVTDTQVIVNR